MVIVNFQMDLYWVTKAGADPVTYFEKDPVTNLTKRESLPATAVREEPEVMFFSLPRTLLFKNIEPVKLK